ncbi:hypothetical protein B0H13DRAFT_2318029 [Mycena leptocephala]|nr:hypothetical protein B0H13DRAFT_2318029 [Mycena leptocephala]
MRGARLPQRRRVRQMVRAFDGGCAVQDGMYLQLLYINSFGSCPHLPLAPAPPACPAACHASTQVTALALYLIPAPLLTTPQYSLPRRMLGAPTLRRQAYAHTRCLLALLGSLTPWPCAPLARKRPHSVPPPLPCPASLAAAALLDPPGGSCLRSLVSSFGSPAPPCPARIALLPRPHPHRARFCAHLVLYPRLLRRSFV